MMKAKRYSLGEQSESGDGQHIFPINDDIRVWALVGLEIYRWSLHCPKWANKLLNTAHQWHWELLVCGQDALCETEEKRARLQAVSEKLDLFQPGIRDRDDWWHDPEQAKEQLNGWISTLHDMGVDRTDCTDPAKARRIRPNIDRFAGPSILDQGLDCSVEPAFLDYFAPAPKPEKPTNSAPKLTSLVQKSTRAMRGSNAVRYDSSLDQLVTPRLPPSRLASPPAPMPKGAKQPSPRARARLGEVRSEIEDLRTEIEGLQSEACRLQATGTTQLSSVLPSRMGNKRPLPAGTDMQSTHAPPVSYQGTGNPVQPKQYLKRGETDPAKDSVVLGSLAGSSPAIPCNTGSDLCQQIRVPQSPDRHQPRCAFGCQASPTLTPMPAMSVSSRAQERVKELEAEAQRLDAEAQWILATGTTRIPPPSITPQPESRDDGQAGSGYSSNGSSVSSQPSVSKNIAAVVVPAPSDSAAEPGTLRRNIRQQGHRTCNNCRTLFASRNAMMKHAARRACQPPPDLTALAAIADTTPIQGEPIEATPVKESESGAVFFTHARVEVSGKPDEAPVEICADSARGDSLIDRQWLAILDHKVESRKPRVVNGVNGPITVSVWATFTIYAKGWTQKGERRIAKFTASAWIADGLPTRCFLGNGFLYPHRIDVSIRTQCLTVGVLDDLELPVKLTRPARGILRKVVSTRKYTLKPGQICWIAAAWKELPTGRSFSFRPTHPGTSSVLVDAKSRRVLCVINGTNQEMKISRDERLGYIEEVGGSALDAGLAAGATSVGTEHTANFSESGEVRPGLPACQPPAVATRPGRQAAAPSAPSAYATPPSTPSKLPAAARTKVRPVQRQPAQRGTRRATKRSASCPPGRQCVRKLEHLAMSPPQAQGDSPSALSLPPATQSPPVTPPPRPRPEEPGETGGGSPKNRPFSKAECPATDAANQQPRPRQSRSNSDCTYNEATKPAIHAARAIDPAPRQHSSARSGAFPQHVQSGGPAGRMDSPGGQLRPSDQRGGSRCGMPRRDVERRLKQNGGLCTFFFLTTSGF